jgi:hypothetical protein
VTAHESDVISEGANIDLFTEASISLAFECLNVIMIQLVLLIFWLKSFGFFSSSVETRLRNSFMIS